MSRKPSRFVHRLVWKDSKSSRCLLRFGSIDSRVFVGIVVFSLLSFSNCVTAQQFTFEPPAAYHDVNLAADAISTWQQGQSDVIHLLGNVIIQQGDVRATADEAVIWVQSQGSEPDLKKLVTYLEGEQVIVRLERQGAPHQETGHDEDAIVDQKWLGRLFARAKINTASEPTPVSDSLPKIQQRALQFLQTESAAEIQPVTFMQQIDGPQIVIDPQTGQLREIAPVPTPSVPDLNIRPLVDEPADSNSIIGPGITPSAAQSAGPVLSNSNRAGAQVAITSRDPTVDLNLNISSNPANPLERVVVGSGGVRVTISSPDLNQLDAFRSDADKQVIILADNVVAWQSPLGDGSDRWELYLEGNVIFAKDRRVIYADQMYYDANFQRGTILNADIFTPVQNFAGLVRMKASVVEQVDANHLTAYGAAFTSSRMAFPRYWLQSDSIELNRAQNTPVIGSDGSAVVDPATGLQEFEDEYFVTSRRNRVYANGVPIFAWPVFRSSLNDPSLYLQRLRLGNDNVFGFQALATFDLYQLLGVRNPPEGTELLGSLDYFSKRGLGVGTESTYRRNSFFGIPGQVRGVYKSWFINDDGTDNLGRGRTMLTPEEEFRGRLLLRHFHRLAPGHNIRAQIGYITDRNFLESFYEREWDSDKDATTGFWLERNIGTRSYNLITEVQVNDFFTETSWLPRYDQFTLGQPLFNNQRIIHHGHSTIGYGRLGVAEPPVDPAEIFDPLAWEADVEGARVGTRQELDFPQQLGPVKVVPYVLGDITYWQEDLNGDDLLRAYGQLGVRATLPIWRSDPTIQSVLWNVNGLAHKVYFDVDAFYADASQNLDQLALYDNLDDNAQEAFRRRFAFNTFEILPGGNVPLMFDERFYALRNGFQSDVTAPSLEIADDLSIIRFGVRQRWQTKRGIPGNQRIIDWVTLDVYTSLFPDAARDNFGADFGQLDYDFEWFVGDRVSLVSDGYFDFFSQGLRTASIGAQTNRPGLGDVYLGFRTIEGPISSNIVTASGNYRMSEKWGLRGLSQVDLGQAGTIVNALSAVFIGESFLWQFGVNADFSRDVVGFQFGLEPRFVQNGRLFRPGRTPLPPASSLYLE